MDQATVSVVPLSPHTEPRSFGLRCDLFLHQVELLAKQYDLAIVSTVPSSFIVEADVPPSELTRVFRDPARYRLFAL